MRKYTIECWLDGRWQLVMSVPQRFINRRQAEARLRFEADTEPPRRVRLVNGRGITVLHAGTNQT